MGCIVLLYRQKNQPHTGGFSCRSYPKSLGARTAVVKVARHRRPGGLNIAHTPRGGMSDIYKNPRMRIIFDSPDESIKKRKMITAEQLKDAIKRIDALRRYL